MKILMVVHLYHPRHKKGVENYTHSLVNELGAMGHSVTVLTTEDRPSVREYTVSRKEVAGHPVIEVVNNKTYRRFSETYQNPRLHPIFGEVLAEVRPDVVHFQHLLYFSVDLVDLAREAGIPCVYTLHEFWFQCLRGGLRLLPGGERCEDVSEVNCARCLETSRLYNGAAAWIVMRGLQVVRQATGLDLHPLIRNLRVRRSGRKTESSSKSANEAWGEVRPKQKSIDEVRHRNGFLREKLAGIDLFISPSRFLRGEMIAFGLDSEKIITSDYGFPASGARRASRPLKSGELRIGFIGNLQPHKGLHVVVNALVGIDDPRISLEVHGNPEHDPSYVRRLMAQDSRIVFRGEFGPDERGAVLDGIDVLVFPSIWYENSPLTIHEALQAGIPVVTSDLGGMKELITPLKNGLTFPAGESVALEECLRQLLCDPELVRRLSQGALESVIKSVRDDASELLAYYEALMRGEEVTSR